MRLFGCLRLRLVVGVGPTYSACRLNQIHPPATAAQQKKERKKKASTRHTFPSRSSTSDVAKSIFIFSVNSNSHPRSFPHAASSAWTLAPPTSLRLGLGTLLTLISDRRSHYLALTEIGLVLPLFARWAEFTILFVHQENHHSTMRISGIRTGIDEPLDDLDSLSRISAAIKQA